jgi:hypothetical protein
MTEISDKTKTEQALAPPVKDIEAEKLENFENNVGNDKKHRSAMPSIFSSLAEIEDSNR